MHTLALSTLKETTRNISSTIEPIQPFVFANQSQANLFGSLTIIIGLLGLFGNLMVFIAVSLSKSLQDPTHVFVVNLAVSDFLTALTLPFNGISVIAGAGWPFAGWMCTLTGALLILSVPTSVLTLAATAFNRYIIITKGLEVQQKIFTGRGITATVALLWIFPFLAVVTPQLIPATGGINYNPITRACLWDLEHPLVIVFQSIGSVIFLCCTGVIIFCYVAISVFVWKHVRATKKRLRASTEDINDEEPKPIPILNKKHIEVTKNLAIVVVVFFICVLPYSFNLYVQYYTIRLSYYALLLTLPTCLNPLIYAVKHPSFKTVFKCMVYCRYQEIPQPSDWLKTIIHHRDIPN